MAQNFAVETALLETMFGGTVSADVIASVIESCDGNVHIAADAIMNFSNELCTPQVETENIEVDPVQVAPVLNVNAPPFEYRQPLAIGNQEPGPPQVSTPEAQHLPTTSSGHSPKLVNQPININLHEPSVTGPLANEQPQTSAQPTPCPRQPPTTARQQSPPEARHHPTPSPRKSFNQQQSPAAGPLSTAEALSVSFSEAFRNSGALPKKPPDSKSQKPQYTMKNVWPDQVGKILHYHNQGARILVIMRGVSGSGKTHLAKHIVDYTVGPSTQNYSRHIFSSDSYFMRRGVYQFNRDNLQEAHATNQRKVWEATNNGVSPIIVDNTNTELWEMEPYIRDGVRNGFMIEFMEPNTSWAWNANQLERRNTHGVQRDSIRRMLDRYEKGITPESAMKTLRLKYPSNKQPPVLRNIPPFSLPGSPRQSPKRTINKAENYKDQAFSASRVEVTCDENPVSSSERHVETNHLITILSDNSSDNFEGALVDEHKIKVEKIIEAQKKIEQFEKVEQEWENGASWDSTSEENKNSSQNFAGGFGSIALDPKPPREVENKSNDNDWSRFMMPWHDSNVTNSGTAVETPVQIETKNVATSFDVEDMNEHMHTVLYGYPRDINDGIPERKSKIPKIIMLDKSTSTHDNDFLSKKEICKNTEYHFRELRRMFKSVPRAVLRDIFESCNLDVNWAVNLVLDSYPESQDNINNNEIISDDEYEEPVEECNCLASYNIIPDLPAIIEIAPAQEPDNATHNTAAVVQKKPKRENKLSDNSLQLKRQIESNVTIPDNHYSQHYLDLRRRRENYIGGNSAAEKVKTSVPNIANSEDIAQSNVSGSDMGENALALPEAISTYNYPKGFRDVAGPSTAHYNLQFLDEDPIDSDTESDSNKSDSLETVTVNLGPEFLEKLDELFGREKFVYPDNIKPVVTLPLSILQQINAHWAMSVAAQMDDASLQSEAMIKQDEEFARQLAAKEQKMCEEGKEPEIPTMKDIMDMEVAYAIYERGVAEWRNNEPQDMAAKLSREKLYNLFPDMSKEVLSEILMAHDYNFKETIESLIVSTGQSNWLEVEKGVEKFVMHKETERKQKFLEEQNKNLDEAEWPYLSNAEKPVTLETVNFYRSEAERSLQCRNANFEKARQYFANNNPSAASFYSDIAALHTRKYEQSSSLAAAYLMNYHLKKNPDNDVLDLHFLRVPEAMVNLDIFLDQIILRLRTNDISSKVTYIITGKGLHSPGGPRIKPATKKRLRGRGITSKLVNGGLLMAELRPADKLTSELL